MLLAANVHLLFEGHLERNVLLLMLFGSVAVFFVSKQFVFAAHKKAEVTFFFLERCVVIVTSSGAVFC